ncbi:hypothetical protein OHA98_08120 [Streptomyces sp. NBC_00654]|uniref:hypothetical protein n=1 Tax=Streptomyces sp. NBC_00654 TaxID=2975799 RepID=UPI00225979D0|nr:hypothetical protein [Streptomyces sp. NBC_00654]MCX4964792.1 hypothetical protein [Streptomyces sp. NBC_00654]
MPALHLRSRAFPATVAALVCLALLAAWAADWLEDRPYFDHSARAPVVALAPLLASSAIGTSLYSHSDELDRTAVRRWWPLRLAHLLALTALAAGALALAVPGHPEGFGAPAMVRNVLGATGVAAASAALLGARPSWLPMTVYGSAVYLAAPRAPGGAAALWAWPMQPGPQTAAWAVALSAYIVGGGLLVLRGQRPERR